MEREDVLPPALSALCAAYDAIERLLLFLASNHIQPTLTTLIRMGAPLLPSFAAHVPALAACGVLRVGAGAGGLVEAIGGASPPARATALRDFLSDHVMRARDAWEGSRGAGKRAAPFDATLHVPPLGAASAPATAAPATPAAPAPAPAPAAGVAVAPRDLEAHLRSTVGGEGQLIYASFAPARAAAFAPDGAFTSLPAPLREALLARGVTRLFSHQAAAAAAAAAG
jgi:hypothetical protein